MGAAIVWKLAPPPGALQDLALWCRARLPEYKIPTRWFVLKEMPRTGRGKLQRALVAELCLRQGVPG